MTKQWQPLAESPALQQRCREQVVMLWQLLQRKAPGLDASLLRGSGTLVLLAAQGINNKIKGFSEQQLVTCLNQTFANVATLSGDNSLFQGMAGIAWLQDHLGSNRDIDNNLTFDQHLIALLKQQPWHGEYELFAGLVGIGIYGVERAERATGLEIVNLVLAQLDALARKAQGQMYWQTAKTALSFRPEFEFEQFDLGCAHGNGAVLGLLLRCAEHQALLAKVKPMITALTDWLVAQQNPPGIGSCFPSLAGLGDKSVLGWCYGDLSLSLNLYRAGLVLNDNSLIDQAINVGLATTTREDTYGGITLCHGAFGHALIYQHWYSLSGLSEFKAKGQFWLELGLSALEQKLDKDLRLSDMRSGLISGLSGIALALMAMSSQQSPKWTQLLLLK